jgi:hypothetical protein
VAAGMRTTLRSAVGCVLSIQKCHVFAVGIFYLYYYYCYYFFSLLPPSPLASRPSAVTGGGGAFWNWMVRHWTPLGAACIFKTSFCSVWISHEEVEFHLLFASAIRLRFAFVVFVRTHTHTHTCTCIRI